MIAPCIDNLRRSNDRRDGRQRRVRALERVPVLEDAARMILRRHHHGLDGNGGARARSGKGNDRHGPRIYSAMIPLDISKDGAVTGEACCYVRKHAAVVKALHVDDRRRADRGGVWPICAVKHYAPGMEVGDLGLYYPVGRKPQ
jgi:hypothetical protein